MYRVRSAKMEEVTKCRYIDCLDGRGKEQILHELPVCDTSLCVRWLINSGHVDLIEKDLDTLRSMKFFVCNNHFTEDCYLSKGTLKENAVPSPHWGDLSRAIKSTRSQRKNQPNGQENSMEGTVKASQGSANNCPSEFEANQWCRTCATKKHNLVSMTSKGKGTEMSLLSKLKLLIEIDDEDALPTKMCDECVDKLEQSYKFFQQIYVADNTLRHVFPNARTNNVSRKPLYSLGEHLKKEQKEKDLEKLKEKEDGLPDNSVPRVTRGLFRRGRGRPRTRGYGGRARGRPRWGGLRASSQVSVPVASIVSTPIPDPVIEEPAKNERENEKTLEERQRSTVFSLLTDTCHSDEELDWSDVLKLMNSQASQWPSKPPVDEPIKTEVEIKAETELQVPVKLEVEQPSVAEPIKAQRKSQEKEAPIAVSVQVEPETSRLQVSESTTTPVLVPPVESKTANCEYCKETFNSKRELQTHSAAVHSQLSGYVCTDCSACYESESLLAKHRALRHGQRRYRCEHCDAEFLEKRVLREHVNKCQRAERTDNSCDLCGVPFGSKEALAEHEASHCKNPAASFQSEDASLKDPLVPDQNREVSASTVTVPPSSDVALISDDTVPGSNSTQETVANAEERVQERTEEQKGESTCPSCNEKLDDTADPSSHRANCRGTKRKDTICLHCGKKSFSSPDEYEQHLLEHSKRSRTSPS